jgi:triacylglycerol lipase
MNFLVLPPEINSALMFSGAGSGPMLAAASAWEGIGGELNSTATAFRAVTSDLAAEAWQGPASVSMAAAAGPYATWLEAAGGMAQESATQAKAAAAAFEAARAAMVEPALVEANRAVMRALVSWNLFGQNAPAIAAAEGAYEQMWAQAVSAMAGYHASSSAAVAPLGSWAQAFQNLPGTINTAFTQAVNNVNVYINGTGVSPAIPATENPTYGGVPGLLTRAEVQGMYFLKAVGVDFSTQIAPLLSSTTPPQILTWLLGETVTVTTSHGMSVVQITPSNPTGEYVVALHGGGFFVQPTLVHWLDYAMMAKATGATIQVPIYPLVQQGGTAGVVVPQVAGIISDSIAAHGVSNVSVYGDSAGGTLGLAAVQYLVTQAQPVPSRMVLISPGLDLSLTNPNISLINDPLLGGSPRVGQQWAGGLPLTDPLVSPLYGSLAGLPPTYVYSGSLEILAPDTLRLVQEAAMQSAPISFVLRTGAPHVWALGSFGDAMLFRTQIYSELGII